MIVSRPVLFPALILILFAVVAVLLHHPKNNNRIYFDGGWKFHAGDNKLWSQPDFDDSGWKEIDPSRDINNFLPALKEINKGWLRMKIPANTLKTGISYALALQQSVASEIYLNGTLIYTIGTVGNENKKTKAYDPLVTPMLFPVTKDSNQLLAVRFAVEADIPYTTIFETSNPLFSVYLLPMSEAIEYRRSISDKMHAFEFLLIGISILFFILHFSLFILYPEKKANLYFAICGLCSIPAYVLRLNLFLYNHSVSAKYYIANAGFILLTLSNLFILLSLHENFIRKKDFILKGLIFLSIFSFFINAMVYDYGWRLGGVAVQILIFLNVARIAIYSVQEKKRGAWIITFGSLSTLVFSTIFFLQGSFHSPSFIEYLTTGRIVSYILFTICIAGTASLYLALDFAFANRTLRQKIRETQELAEKNLLQEKEKHELLSSMNEKLEAKVIQRTGELQQSLDHLRITQAQLVHHEKMASLGSLTAGIAHEIQNPLNFVNNFSEISNELIDEMKAELATGNQQLATEIADNIKQNLEKINHHGQRADAIVKGMLQHSRGSSGQKEPTGISTLCDEYLKLAYHSFRTRDKSFFTAMKTDFDESIDNINIVPADIGRVILNIINNAFYAVDEKRKSGFADYKPTISIHTRMSKGKMEIGISDNGNGIPQKIVDKIFQPFFTTKPTGQGTGLGLSLSYDIVKAHGGEIKVETKEGEGTTFFIVLPF